MGSYFHSSVSAQRPTYPRQATRLPGELRGSRRAQCRTNFLKSSGPGESTSSSAHGNHSLANGKAEVRKMKQLLAQNQFYYTHLHVHLPILHPWHPTTSTSFSSLEGPDEHGLRQKGKRLGRKPVVGLPSLALPGSQQSLLFAMPRSLWRSGNCPASGLCGRSHVCALHAPPARFAEAAW